MLKVFPRVVLGAALLLALSAVPAGAQGNGEAAHGGSFEQLALKIRIGDTVFVTDNSGREQKGKVVDLSPQALSVLVKGMRQDVKPGDVTAVDLQHGDSLKNGALIGFGVGAGIGAGMMVAAWAADGEGGDGVVPLAVISGAMWGGIGAALGAGIDALVEERVPVYRAAAPHPATAKITIGPMLSRDRKGVAIAVRFAP